MITTTQLEKELERIKKRRHDGSAIEVSSLSGSILTCRKLMKVSVRQDSTDSNHKIGCMLESYAQELDFRGFEKEAKQLDEIASRIK